MRAATGKDNIEALHKLGLTGDDVVLAHCVQVTDKELKLLARTNTRVAHCPSTNLKLASGIAPLTEFIAKGISFGIAADGAPCNNRLSAFTERLIRRRLGSRPMSLSLSFSPGANAPRGSASLSKPSSEIGISPLRPGSSSTKTPKSAPFSTVPSTVWPS